MASGCPMLCSLTELDNHAYVRDDTMFIKIVVDTTDLEKSEARSLQIFAGYIYLKLFVKDDKEMCKKA